MVTDLTRRHFVGLCAGLGVAPLASLSAASGAPAFLSAYRDPHGQYGVAALDDTGTVLFTEILPARGHDTVMSPDGRTAVTFARRPGRFALLTDLTRQTPALALEAAPDRHFYGHGFFSNNGRLLFATENHYTHERGVIGVYDAAAGYQRVGEFDTHGIGPHEALLLSDGRTIAVANGGILTHPDYPRQKLNLATLAPSLSYIDSDSGDLIEQANLPSELHQLSIRHLTQTADGAIWFGGQYEGSPSDEIDLVGQHQRGQEIQMVGLHDQQRRALRQYVGSIKASADGRRVALTSPRGGVALVVSATDRSLIETVELPDVCGATPSPHSDEGFTFSSGAGTIMLRRAASTSAMFHWDNHLQGLNSPNG
jgi:hypothetical protein